MEQIEAKILEFLQNSEIEDSREFAKNHDFDHLQVVGQLKSLDSDNYVVLKQKEYVYWSLTAEGNQNCDEGTPEFILYSMIPEEGIQKSEVPADLYKFGFQNGMKKKWMNIFDKVLIKRTMDNVVDDDRLILQQIKSKNTEGLTKDTLDTLKKRKLITQETEKYLQVSKGSNYNVFRKKKCTEFTSEMILNGTWKDADFKPYNFKTMGKEIATGNLHPLLKVRTQFREILLEMGFSEMPTNNYVENSFYNFDALFQPQQHPARDSHDTFFMSDPEFTKIKEPQYWQRVKQMHEQGDHQSIGWRYDWSETEARKNIMRTHTTAVSARMLYALAQQKEFKPTKLFSIDRVFRNETLDATHLAEFHQVEGVVADRNLSLGHLKGIIREFFNKIGIKDIWFKAAYNPYTEPSMEIFGYHPILKRKVEIGNSGIFRPEMLAPMGLPADVNVIAWGLSLERPTMIQYNVGNIRELFGHKVDAKYIKENPICCFK